MGFADPLGCGTAWSGRSTIEGSYRLDPVRLPCVRSGIRRVKGVKKLGVRLGNWLTAEEARRPLTFADGEELFRPGIVAAV